MVENLGINVLVPILVFLILIVGGIMITNKAIEDVNRRRSSGEY